ncbi:lateral signaling target protein 2 homolog isoform X2 [Cephus cinctus]|uniref:Lateral signaling target protein 2 homolog isoform X2 n=1 Tax=Cephus cinctus TaxID=211228 RepID=A0AAJ7BX94_CEPCN|nr:lateral signaling target protein 2 homolog isoform X2 [Cephus cinctus]
MTVMPSSSDVADKAVSTEDAASGVEVVRLEAVLAALVETKVEAMKASTTARRSGSAPPSPRRLRLTSSSTASSSQNHHHHHHSHHHHSHHHHQHRQHEQLPHDEHRQHEKRKREDRRRRHDSAPCGEYIEDPTVHNNHKQRSGKGRRRASENPRSPRKRRRHSKSPQVGHRVVQDFHGGLETGLDLSGIDGDQELALINFERAREGLSDSCEYPKLHRSACCFSQSAAQLKIHYDEDDYVALNLDDEFEEEESLPAPEKRGNTVERYHRPRRKRKRRRVEPESVEEELGDPEELPPRARWTIVATACLLLAMSLLLVGVTLRMAPIIDDMVRKENEELLNSLNRDSSVPVNTTVPP